jgi:hypothetical protein
MVASKRAPFAAPAMTSANTSRFSTSTSAHCPAFKTH